MGKIRIKRSTLKRAGRVVIIILSVAAVAIAAITLTRRCSSGGGGDGWLSHVPEVMIPKTMFGIEYEQYDVVSEKVGDGQTLSHLLGALGVGSATIDRIDREARPVYDLRNVRAGQPYTAMLERDTTGGVNLRHFIYEKSRTEYVMVSIAGDSMRVRNEMRDVTIKRRKETVDISSSLWNAIIAKDIPAAISCDVEDIFGWSIDFFGLQEGDKFTVVFDEHWIDTVRVGTGRVWGAEFEHYGKTYHAIPFRIDDKLAYWDENGNSLRKQFLKAPLKFTRISSKFGSRVHPVHRVRRPHNGVDYAAPSGTPIVAIADGTVTMRGWDRGGGGNTLKIKHSNGYVSGYLHMSRYAKGIALGRRVAQGELIGYVGSTGVSTGPHLDFRIWKNNKPIDPLKIPSASVEPIPAAHMEAFKAVRDKVMAELDGDVPDENKLTEI